MKPYAIFALTLAVAACGGGSNATPAPTGTPGSTPPPALYQPLAVGDQWTYACGLRGQPSTFTIQNSIAATATVAGQTVYEFALQVPSSPAQISTTTMLLANDSQNNLVLYGYVVNGAVQTVNPTVIAGSSPTPGEDFSYPAADGTTVTRTFESFTATNSTPYAGVYPRVAVYYESNATHNYGYDAGLGIAEEDHGPNFQYDCLLSGLTLK
jgi:hypothetical protein